MKINPTLEILVHQYIDGKCSAEQLAELSKILEGDAHARDYYFDNLLLHKHLGLLSATTQIKRSNISPMGSLVKEERKRSFTVSVSTAAALIAILLIALSIIKIRQKRPLFTLNTSPGTQYEITKGGEKQSSPGMEAGSQLKISQGVLKLESSSGTQVVIQGPATLKVIGEEHFALHGGAAWFQASEKNHSILVTTPLLEVLDLGTEFGVMTKQGYSMPEVHVFDGTVQVTSKDKLKKTQTLNKGEAIILTPFGQLKAIKADETAFFRSLPITEPHAYFTFEEDPNHGIEPATGSLPCVPHINQHWNDVTQPRYVDGIVGQAARFDNEQSAIITDWSGPSRKRPFSISLWMRYNGKEAPKKMQCILGWGATLPAKRLEEFHLNLRTLDDKRAVAHLVLDQNQYIGHTDLSDGEWHQLTITRHPEISQQQANHFKVYLDGIQETIEASTFGYSPPLPSSSGLATANFLIGRSSSLHLKPHSFTGDLDELRIYETVISEKRITELSER